MTTFSRQANVGLGSVVAGGHPPIIHNVALSPAFDGISAGTPVLVTDTGVIAWDGLAIPVDAMVALGIALQQPQEGDASTSVLLHGCYRSEMVMIAGVALTNAQRLILTNAGLYAEDAWGV